MPISRVGNPQASPTPPTSPNAPAPPPAEAPSGFGGSQDYAARGGTNSMPPSPTPLSRGPGFSGATVQQLGQMADRAGFPQSGGAQQGDVDIDISTGPTFIFPAAADSQQWVNVQAAWAGDNLALQGRWIQAYGAHIQAGRSTQVRSEAHLFPSGLSPEGRSHLLGPVTQDIAAWNGDYSEASMRSFESMFAHNGSIDVNALVQWVLRESYLDVTENMRLFAEKVRHFNEQKKMIRDHLNGLREFNANFTGERAKAISDMGWQEPEDSAAIQAWEMQHLMTHGNNTGNSVMWRQAYSDSVDNCLVRADSMIEERFGVGLPPELTTILREALESKDPVTMQNAFRDVAGYVAYLGDCNVKDGKFGAGDGYDDADHIDPSPSWSDYQHYLRDDVNKNRQARTNLATGDVRALEAAFGLPDGILGGSSSYTQIVEAAMSPVGDAWRNFITHDRFDSTDKIMAQIREEGINGPLAQEMFGSPEAARDALYGADFMADDEQGQIRQELGMPSTIPPPGITTKEQFDAEIQKWESELSSVGDDAQLANVDLQNWLQKQQQVLQMLSNISKVTHDTAMAIIRKMS